MLLEVYNNPNHPNHGITFRIIDHELPLPHDAGSVILVFHGREYSATVGASYRFVGKYKEAMPYLLLCLKLEPGTPYLVGNIYLCLVQLRFQQEEALRAFLTPLAKDLWSKDIIKN